jgi:hypothetical protein
VRPVRPLRSAPLALAALGLPALLLQAVPAIAQDGRIVSRDTVRLSAELRSQVERPLDAMGLHVDGVLDAVVVHRIDYLSGR